VATEIARINTDPFSGYREEEEGGNKKRKGGTKNFLIWSANLKNSEPKKHQKRGSLRGMEKASQVGNGENK